MLISLFSFSSLKGQETIFKHKGSVSIDVGIPTKNQNTAFGLTMEGLFNGGAAYQYNVYKGITLGAGFKYSYFNIDPVGLGNAAIKGGLHMPAIYAKVGYEKFTTERVSFNLSVRGGYSFNISANDTCNARDEGAHTVASAFIEPQFEMVFLTEKNSPHGFSLVTGYSFYFFEYGPEFLCRESIPNTVPENYEGISRFFSIGFGYRYYLGKN